MEKFTEILEAIDGVVWGVPLIVLIMGTGIFLTVRIKVLQFRKLGKAFKYMVKNEEDGIGEVTSFGALLYGHGSYYRYGKHRRCGYGSIGGRPGGPLLDDSGGLSGDGDQVLGRTVGR